MQCLRYRVHVIIIKSKRRMLQPHRRILIERHSGLPKAPPKAGAEDRDLTFSSHTTTKIDEAKEVSSSGMG